MFSLKDSRVEPVSLSFAAPLILKYEFMGTMPGWCSHAFGHFFDAECAGVVVFGCPIGQYQKMFPRKKVLQLHRGVSLLEAPHNSSSFLISRSLRLLSQTTDFDVVVAFSNPLDGEIGTVYQASNWSYGGMSAAAATFILDGGRTSVQTLRDRCGTSSASKLQEIYGSRLQVIPKSGAKHRYFYSLRKDLSIPSQTYPKRAKLCSGVVRDGM